MAETRQGVPLPQSRQRPDWRTGSQVSRAGKYIDVEIVGGTFTDATFTDNSAEPYLVYGTNATATMTAAVNTDQSIATLTLPTAGTWLITGMGFQDYSIGADVQWTISIVDSVAGTLVVTRDRALFAAGASGKISFSLFVPFITTTVGDAISLEVQRDSTSGSQVATNYRLWAIRSGK
jgi:hypothetical protein